MSQLPNVRSLSLVGSANTPRPGAAGDRTSANRHNQAQPGQNNQPNQNKLASIASNIATWFDKSGVVRQAAKFEGENSSRIQYALHAVGIGDEAGASEASRYTILTLSSLRHSRSGDIYLLVRDDKVFVDSSKERAILLVLGDAAAGIAAEKDYVALQYALPGLVEIAKYPVVRERDRTAASVERFSRLASSLGHPEASQGLAQDLPAVTVHPAVKQFIDGQLGGPAQLLSTVLYGDAVSVLPMRTDVVPDLDALINEFNNAMSAQRAIEAVLRELSNRARELQADPRLGVEEVAEFLLPEMQNIIPFGQSLPPMSR